MGYGLRPKVKEAILQGIARGDIWLAKIKRDQRGDRVYANVCLEVFLKSRGTCLLEHINLGACTTDELPLAFTAGMQELIDLHGKTGVEKTGEYLTQEEDRQVGLGMLGSRQSPCAGRGYVLLNLVKHLSSTCMRATTQQ